MLFDFWFFKDICSGTDILLLTEVFFCCRETKRLCCKKLRVKKVNKVNYHSHLEREESLKYHPGLSLSAGIEKSQQRESV